MAAKKQSRPERWRDAAGRAVSALEELVDLQSGYEEWRDNLPENLQNSALGEKLNGICDVDLQSAYDAAQEADSADLPMGFGRD